MTIWQADFYRRPLRDETDQPLWELVICDRDDARPRLVKLCAQPQVSPAWVAEQLHTLTPQGWPECIQVFRPQSLNLIEAAGQMLGITVEPTRRTEALKALLQERATEYPHMAGYTGEAYEPTRLDQPPPMPLPELVLGERWRFAAIAASELEPAFQHQPIPIKSMPKELLPLNQRLASTTLIPGVVIDGGRQSMRLARWLQDVTPAALRYISGQPDGLILEAGLVDRWVLATFDDREVAAAAQTFVQRLKTSNGLHFLLVQPDDSGMTYSGFWLLSL